MSVSYTVTVALSSDSRSTIAVSFVQLEREVVNTGESGNVAELGPQWAINDTTGGPPMPLGERIKQLRKEHGWSQAELGERIGTDSQRVSRYENERITPSIDALIRLATALAVSCDYLLIGDAPRRPFRSADRHLGERFAAIEELPPEDLAAPLNHLDALIAKKRLKTIAGHIS